MYRDGLDGLSPCTLAISAVSGGIQTDRCWPTFLCFGQFISYSGVSAPIRSACLDIHSYIGLVPLFAEVRDAVFLIQGTQAPSVLRTAERPLLSKGSRVLCPQFDVWGRSRTRRGTWDSGFGNRLIWISSFFPRSKSIQRGAGAPLPSVAAILDYPLKEPLGSPSPFNRMEHTLNSPTPGTNTYILQCYQSIQLMGPAGALGSVVASLKQQNT